MPQRDATPQRLADQHRPPAVRRKMSCRKQQLVARNTPDGVRMPPAQRRAARVYGAGLGHITSCDAEPCAAQAELGILQIGLEALIEEARLLEDTRANQYRGERR